MVPLKGFIVKVANALREIVRRFPETREQIVRILADELARHQKDLPNLNGFLVGHLADLKAVEAAETIERSFAANVIDPAVAGDWQDIRGELGVPGLGIASDRSPGWPLLGARCGELQMPGCRCETTLPGRVLEGTGKAGRQSRGLG